jgi:hypothetical protein
MVNSVSFLRGALLAALLTGPSGFTGASEPCPQAATQEPSLGEKARELRAKASQESKKPAKVYTNDDLRAGGEGISVLGGGPTASAPSVPPEAGGKRDQKYYRQKMAELQGRLDLHRRELDVIQQKLDINQLQYYPDPYQTLKQEYSRSDINRLQREVEAKTQQVKADEQAIADLQTELRLSGGDPGWLRVVPGSQTEKQAAGQPEEVEESPKAKPGTREYWQSRFKSARAKLAKAQETQQLAEDELNLLQIQQARQAPRANVAAELGQKIAAKQAEVDSARAATHHAELALDALQQEFAASGAPEEWSKEP